MSGWIKIHRSISDHWVWECEYSQGQAWIDLLCHACHKDNTLTIKGQLIRLKRGDQARSEVTLSKTWKWSRNKVRRFLKNLENDSMIERKTTHLTSIISICNYDNFQSRDTSVGTANDTSVGTAKGQVSEHKQECKELKEWKESKFEEFWNAYSKKEGKAKCSVKFGKLSKEEIEKIILVVGDYVARTPDIQFRKNPLTWLNGSHWEDEVTSSDVGGDNAQPDWMRGML